MIIVELERTEFDFDHRIGLNNAFDKYAAADEVGNVAINGLVIEIVGRIPLHNSTFGHHADMIGDRKGFELIVRDQQGGDAVGFQNITHLAGESFAQVDVQT